VSKDPKNLTLLGELKKGSKGTISRINRDGNYPVGLIERLLEMGLLEGTLVEVVHEAPFGGDPFAIRVRGSLLALRRHEANAIEVDQSEVNQDG
jgi:ferrous iron transport protein A